MNSEAKVYLDAMDGLRGTLRRILDEADAQFLNWNPLPGEANSLYAIAAHMCATELTTVQRRITGQPVEAGYADTFAEQGDDPGDLLRRVEETERTTHSLLEGLNAEDMDRVVEPAGGDSSRTVRELLSGQLRHQALHMGHIEITKQLYEAGVIRPR